MIARVYAFLTLEISPLPMCVPKVVSLSILNYLLLPNFKGQSFTSCWLWC